LFVDIGLDSPILNTSLMGSVKYNKRSPEKSNMENISMRISSVKPKLKSALKNLERFFDVVIPSEGDDFVLEIRGELDKPQIKGIHY